MKFIFITTFICISLILQAQNYNKQTTKKKAAIKLYEQARNDYGIGITGKAAKVLNEAIAKDSKFIEAYLLLGDIYNTRKEYLKEMETLIKAVAIDSTFFPVTMFNIGEAAFNAGLYLEAISWYERYSRSFANPRYADRVKNGIENSLFAMEMVKKPYDIDLHSVGDGINSIFHEYWPCLTADEQTMVFTVLVPKDMQLYEKDELYKSALYFQEDFYQSIRSDDGTWLQREPLKGNINTDSNEGAQTLSADGNMMFFTACGRPDSKGSCDIYFSYKLKDAWSEPKNIGAPVNSAFWESQPCFGADGKTLLFVSNRPDGFGGQDIWQATLKGFNSEGTPYFGDLKNLGNKINTTGHDCSPFLHHDNNTLYFSSDGWKGMGGLDIFVSRKDETGEWTEPVNLGYPINTSGDETGLVINAKGNRAYFASDFNETQNTGRDIYYFNLPSEFQPTPALYVKGRVFDAETNENLPANFQLQDLATGNLVITTRSNKYSGEFLVTLPLGGSYAFMAEHPGYMFYSGHFDIEKDHSLDKTYQLDIALNPIKAGVKIVLENIFYETNSFELLEQSKIELDELVRFLNENPAVRILISGHTDNVGTAAYNQKLSENRAESVFKYLIAKGIKQERLLFKGFGLNNPVDTNDTEEGRAKNRRTEIMIL
jgi:outer membrane protein OmpA-like peptidoglycan-associated protein